MNTITLQEIKSHGAKVIRDDGVTYLIVNSRPKSVLVPPAEYEMLLAALEELEDRTAIANREKEPTIPFNKIFPKKK